ncbi:hypothetical protein MMC28_005035 [Mycoblastus sanguinarius]|nr:hypothetical protein [Mycoblastus sanguinarius]
MVHNVHKRVRQMRYGPDLEEMGGTKLDKPTKNYLDHYLDEIRDQFRRGPSEKK